MDAFKQFLSIFLTTVSVGGLMGVIYNIWRNRGRIKIYSVDYKQEHLIIKIENIGREINSISMIMLNGLTMNRSKHKVNCNIILPSTLPINEKIDVTVQSDNPEDIWNLAWFITIKISFTKSRVKKIRLRHWGNWTNNNIKLFRFYIEKFFYLRYPNFYHKHINKTQNPMPLE